MRTSLKFGLVFDGGISELCPKVRLYISKAVLCQSILKFGHCVGSFWWQRLNYLSLFHKLYYTWPKS